MYHGQSNSSCAVLLASHYSDKGLCTDIYIYMNISPWFMPEMTSPQNYSCLVVMISPGLRNASVVTIYKKMNV